MRAISICPERGAAIDLASFLPILATSQASAESNHMDGILWSESVTDLADERPGALAENRSTRRNPVELLQRPSSPRSSRTFRENLPKVVSKIGSIPSRNIGFSRVVKPPPNFDPGYSC